MNLHFRIISAKRFHHVKPLTCEKDLEMSSLFAFCTKSFETETREYYRDRPSRFEILHGDKIISSCILSDRVPDSEVYAYISLILEKLKGVPEYKAIINLSGLGT